MEGGWQEPEARPVPLERRQAPPNRRGLPEDPTACLRQTHLTVCLRQT